jgi:hypothetical protein
MENREKLESLIDSAWENFGELAADEEEGDYSDAMLSMERTEAYGYAEGLGVAYHLIFGEAYTPKTPIYGVDE